MSSFVPELLREYGSVTRESVEHYLPHEGWQNYFSEPLVDYPRRGGKMMRPGLCIATAKAYGADIEEAIGSATAIELLHNALLIHDDIQDGSEERRGIPTLHELHGIPLAINAGDTLAMLSLRPLIDNVAVVGPRLATAIMEQSQHMAMASAEGQAMELGWIRDQRLDLKDRDYLEMVLKKTCWLATIFPVLVGAIIGTRGNIDLDPLVRYGFLFGAAFQIQDDLMNLEADDRYGKEINGDIFEGKRTLMLLHVYREADACEQERLVVTMAQSREQRTPSEVEWVRALMEKYGSLQHARGVAHGLAGAALHEYAMTFAHLPPSRDRDFLKAIVEWVFLRTS